MVQYGERERPDSPADGPRRGSRSLTLPVPSLLGEPLPTYQCNAQ